MALDPAPRRQTVEMRFEVPSQIAAILDACCRDKQSRAELANEILAAYCGEKVRFARRILRVADDDEGTVA